MTTYSLTHLLNGISISLNSAAVFKALVKLRYAEIIHIVSPEGKRLDSYFRLVGDGLKYGENVWDTRDTKKSNPRFYKETFKDMLAKVVFRIICEYETVMKENEK